MRRLDRRLKNQEVLPLATWIATLMDDRVLGLEHGAEAAGYGGAGKCFAGAVLLTCRVYSSLA
jgi:hypothetical protein